MTRFHNSEIVYLMSINQRGSIIPAIGILLLLVTVAGGAYYFGIQQNKPQPQMSVQTPPPIAPVQNSPSSNLNYQDQNTEWVEYTNKAISGNSFKAYTIKYPSDWSRDVQREEDTLDTLTLSKNNYKITITQAGMGGGGCIFDGIVPEGPYADYRSTPFVEVDYPFGVLRRIEKRANEPNITRFEFCASSDKNSYQSPTQVGAISYTIPVDYDPKILKEMDEIIGTLKEVSN